MKIIRQVLHNSKNIKKKEAQNKWKRI